MKFLVAVEKYKTKILKIVIMFATITMYMSSITRFILSRSLNQLYMTMDAYSISFITLIFCSEFIPCILCNLIEKNLHLLNHYTGKGIIFILLSIIYMAPELEETSNPKFVLLCTGILCILGDFTYDKEEKNLGNKKNDLKNISCNEKTNCNNESKIITIPYDTSELETSKKTSNPYDYPDDF